MENSDSTPSVAQTALPLKKENVAPITPKIAELAESRKELLGRIQNLKQDLQNWRMKLDTQVKVYHDELSELKKSLNTEVEQLRTEFQELRTTLQQQQEDVSSNLKSLGVSKFHSFVTVIAARGFGRTERGRDFKKCGEWVAISSCLNLRTRYLTRIATSDMDVICFFDSFCFIASSYQSSLYPFIFPLYFWSFDATQEIRTCNCVGEMVLRNDFFWTETITVMSDEETGTGIYIYILEGFGCA
ncbi:Sec-independent protein translocase protein TatB [Striga asiatica]|uniref:Sec-independent protein translocase protein TatB n=1 Tax=Striga asiatica TaxID=4170 RepID=A0A5A7PCD5_STRAF|nr:Sec-independent protein translocase protein TatB [Striga asiatica]